MDHYVRRETVLFEKEVFLATLESVPPRRRALFHLAFEVETQIELAQFLIPLNRGDDLADVPALLGRGSWLCACSRISCVKLVPFVRCNEADAPRLFSIEETEVVLIDFEVAARKLVVAISEIALELSGVIETKVVSELSRLHRRVQLFGTEPSLVQRHLGVLLSALGTLQGCCFCWEQGLTLCDFRSDGTAVLRNSLGSMMRRRRQRVSLLQEERTAVASPFVFGWIFSASLIRLDVDSLVVVVFYVSTALIGVIDEALPFA